MNSRLLIAAAAALLTAAPAEERRLSSCADGPSCADRACYIGRVAEILRVH